MTTKVCVITGGSRGIGRVSALAMAKEGYQLAILYAGNAKRAEDTLAKLQELTKAKSYRCDVSKAHEVKEVFKEILQDFGRIDVLVNNAGITRDSLLLRMKEEDFSDVLAVNLTGSFHCIKAVTRAMMKQGSGSIINVSSVVGLIGNPGQANYCASKAGLIGMTKSVAKELGRKGIRCNAVAPGYIETEMTKDLDNDALKDMISLPRLGQAEDIAKAIVFLAGDNASYITGTVLSVDGGLGM